MMRLVVTQGDINNGTPGAENCPITQALKRCVPAKFASVGTALLAWDDADNPRATKFQAEAPLELIAWWQRFDRGLLVEPITIEV